MQEMAMKQAQEQMDIIKVKNLKKIYGKSAALRGVNFHFKKGEHYSIVGASGSGKSTLLYLIGGLEKPTEGEVLIRESSLNQLNEEQLAHFRNRELGFIFQFHFLLPGMTAKENILLPLQLNQKSKIESKEVHQRVQLLANRLKVQHLLNKFPYELSGGEQQRINIIRALSLAPKILLCDEPTGNLDSQNSWNVVATLKELAHEFQSTLILVTHDNEIARSFTSQLKMQDGLLVPI